MTNFYVPWVGPDKGRVWILIVLLIAALFISLLYIPVATCSANDDQGICAAPVNPPGLQSLETVGVPMWRSCPCNTSLTIRDSANARTLSNTVFANGESPPTPELRGLSSLGISILQFVLNDISAPVWNGTLYQVPIPVGDPFFPTPGNISVPNSVIAIDGQGCYNPRSYTTPYIDLSNIYGVDSSRLSLQLRAQRGGRMLLETSDELLPYAGPGAAFLMADPRDGYTADLVALHTLMVRNHNAWAERVASIHQEWTDDQLFWKARQLNVAEWQHIVFTEWLPALLGSVAPAHRTSLTSFDSSLVAAVRLEVATVVGPAFVDTFTPATYQTISWQAQHGITNAATLIQTEGIDEMLVRMIKTPALAFDDRVINARRNLYNGTTPEDLVVTHVQRARNLRVPDWAAIYTCFGTAPIAGDSRDAYQGFLEEAIYPGTSAGLTGAALLGSELARLRDADPYFYSFRRTEIGQIFWDDVLHGTMRGIIFRNGNVAFPQIGTGSLFFIK